MATETNLTKVNVFPDEVSYEQNKSSLGSGELSLIPIPAGLTVSGESKIEDGYIIFDNGLFIQWGSGTELNANTVINFPYPFPNEVYSVVANNLYGGNASYVSPTAITKTGFVLMCPAYGNNSYYYIAVGR